MHWTHQRQATYRPLSTVMRAAMDGGSRMRRAFLSAVWLAATMLVALSETSAAEESLRIDSSASLTGKQYALQGGYCREGYLLCQKHENALGGVLGRPIEFVM